MFTHHLAKAVKIISTLKLQPVCLGKISRTLQFAFHPHENIQLSDFFLLCRFLVFSVNTMQIKYLCLTRHYLVAKNSINKVSLSSCTNNDFQAYIRHHTENIFNLFPTTVFECFLQWRYYFDHKQIGTYFFTQMFHRYVKLQNTINRPKLAQV